jgi:hypothetical protein
MYTRSGYRRGTSHIKAVLSFFKMCFGDGVKSFQILSKHVQNKVYFRIRLYAMQHYGALDTWMYACRTTDIEINSWQPVTTMLTKIYIHVVS